MTSNISISQEIVDIANKVDDLVRDPAVMKHFRQQNEVFSRREKEYEEADRARQKEINKHSQKITNDERLKDRKAGPPEKDWQWREEHCEDQENPVEGWFPPSKLEVPSNPWFWEPGNTTELTKEYMRPAQYFLLSLCHDYCLEHRPKIIIKLGFYQYLMKDRDGFEPILRQHAEYMEPAYKDIDSDLEEILRGNKSEDRTTIIKIDNLIDKLEELKKVKPGSRYFSRRGRMTSKVWQEEVKPYIQGIEYDLVELWTIILKHAKLTRNSIESAIRSGKPDEIEDLIHELRLIQREIDNESQNVSKQKQQERMFRQNDEVDNEKNELYQRAEKMPDKTIQEIVDEISGRIVEQQVLDWLRKRCLEYAKLHRERLEAEQLCLFEDKLYFMAVEEYATLRKKQKPPHDFKKTFYKFATEYAKKPIRHYSGLYIEYLDAHKLLQLLRQGNWDWEWQKKTGKALSGWTPPKMFLAQDPKKHPWPFFLYGPDRIEHAELEGSDFRPLNPESKNDRLAMCMLLALVHDEKDPEPRIVTDKIKRTIPDWMELVPDFRFSKDELTIDLDKAWNYFSKDLHAQYGSGEEDDEGTENGKPPSIYPPKEPIEIKRGTSRGGFSNSCAIKKLRKAVNERGIPVTMSKNTLNTLKRNLRNRLNDEDSEYLISTIKFSKDKIWIDKDTYLQINFTEFDK